MKGRQRTKVGEEKTRRKGGKLRVSKYLSKGKRVKGKGRRRKGKRGPGVRWRS